MLLNSECMSKTDEVETYTTQACMSKPDEVETYTTQA